MKDHYGNKINIGDVIAYPGRCGSSLWMNTAVVREITTRSHKDETKRTPILKVTTINMKFSWLERCEMVDVRKTCIERSERVVPIAVENLPSEIGSCVIRVLEEMRGKR